MAETSVAEEQVVTGDQASNADAAPVESNDDQERAVFDELYRRTVASQESGDDTVAEEAKETEEESKDGEAEAEEEEVSEAEDSDSKEPVEPEASDDKTEEQPEGFDQAIAALVRDGLPEERIQRWYNDKPEEFLSHGQKRAKAQADQDRFGNEYRDWLKGQGSEQSDTLRRQPAAVSEAVDASSVQEMIDEALSPLVNEENLDLLGEAKDPIAKALSGLAEHLTADIANRFSTELKERDDKINSLQIARVADQIEAARSLMSSEFPQLEDGKVQEEVLKRYDTIVQSPGNAFDTVGGVYREAVKWTLADSRLDDLKSSMLKRAHSRRNGQPRATTTGSRERNLTSEEQERLDFGKMYRQVFGQTAEG